MLKILLLLFVLLMAFSMTCSAREWNGIVPLLTTRPEVTAKLGTPLIDKETNKEYFMVGEDRVEITWTRADCYDEKKVLITDGDIPQDALVYQITVLPKLPNELSKDVQKLMEADDDEPEPSVSGKKELRNTYKKWLDSDVNCIGSGEPSTTLSCTVLGRTVGFGYSSADGGVNAMYFFPSKNEQQKWKSIHSPCLNTDPK